MPIIKVNHEHEQIEFKLFPDDNMTFYTTAEGARAFGEALIAAADELIKPKIWLTVDITPPQQS